MVVIRVKHIVAITSAKPIFFMFTVLIFLSQTKVFIVVYLCWCYAWCGQDGQDAWSELHACHSEGRRVHIHLTQCWRHPWPCCHLPGGVEETIQVCHRHPGLFLPRSVTGKGFCDACHVWQDDYVCHFVCVPVFAWNWPVLSCLLLLDTDVLPGDDERVMPTSPSPCRWAQLPDIPEGWPDCAGSAQRGGGDELWLVLGTEHAHRPQGRLPSRVCLRPAHYHSTSRRDCGMLACSWHWHKQFQIGVDFWY